MAKPPPAPLVADPQDTVTFSALIAHLEDGQFDRDLTDALRNLVARISSQYRAAGGRPSAKISLTIDFQLIDGIVQTVQTFDIKPIPARSPDRFFPTKEGTLTQSSPFVQTDLGMRVGGAAKGSR